MTTSPIETGADAAKSGIAAGAKAAKSTVRAARKAIDAGLDAGHSRASDALESVRGRADGVVQAAEGLAVAALDSLAHRGRSRVNRARDRAYDVSRSFAPRRGPPLLTALVGLGAGALLTSLLLPRAAKTGAAAGADGAARPL